MQYVDPLIEGRLLGRRKRFLADIELANKERVVAHCPNPGSMASCMQPGCRVWVRNCQSPRRKLDYTWEISEVEQARILVHAARCNRVVEESLRAGAIAKLSQYHRIYPEHAVDEHTRFDFLLTNGASQCLVEVKSVTLSLGQGRLAFPDSPTVRGQKHVRTLLRHRKEGRCAVLFFCAARSDARTVECAQDIDPRYADAVRCAVAGGVEILVHQVDVTPQGLALGRELPFIGP